MTTNLELNIGQIKRVIVKNDSASLNESAFLLYNPLQINNEDYHLI